MMNISGATHKSCHIKRRGNAGQNNYIKFTGVKPEQAIDPSRLNFSTPQCIFHPMVRFDGDQGRTDLINPQRDCINHVIYAPVLIEREDSWYCLYGGWEMNWEPWAADKRGATDKLYTLRINDLSLSKWEDETTPASKKLVLRTDAADPSLYHINDPCLVDLGQGHYRAYFEMECINALDTFGADPRKWQAPADGSHGINTHNIACAESFDYGTTWSGRLNGAVAGTVGKVDRANSVFIQGLTEADYAYYQIGWPSVVRYGDRYLMYFNAMPKNDIDRRSISVARTWEDNNNRRRETRDGPEPNHRFSGNLLLAESNDGIEFQLVGEIRDRHGAGVRAANPDVMLINGTSQAMLVYNSARFEYGTVKPMEKGQWALGTGYLDLGGDPLKMEFINPHTPSSLDGEAMPFYPAIFNPDRDDMAPHWIADRTGEIIGIGYGQWKRPVIDDSWIAAAFLQNHVTIKDSAGNVVADYNTAAGRNELYVSSAAVYREGVPWITLSGNRENPNGDKVIEKGSIEVTDICGNLICKAEGLDISPGDIFEIETRG